MLKTLENEHKLIDREKQLLITYGTAASEAMFDFPCHFFRIPDCIGAIPYRIESHCAVVFGEPLCPEEETSKLIEAFHLHCREAQLNVIYIIVSEKFAKWAKNNHHCNVLIEACEELVIDPQLDPFQASHRLKHRVEKAVKHGLTFHEYLPEEAVNPAIEKALKQIAFKWQEAIKGPNIYLGHLDFFENYTGKRWFYVKDGEQITSMVMLSKLEAKDGWLLKFLITSPGVFHETSEFLMASMLEVLRKENCRFLTKGVVPSDYLREIDGLNAFTRWNIKFVYKIISWFFKFKQRKAYWLRYNPKIEPTYLLFERPHLGLNEIKALIKVFRSNIPMLSRHH
jgi:lysylphosphatidylglycerol synthetase-like protein (DUF2156 family)